MKLTEKHKFQKKNIQINNALTTNSKFEVYSDMFILNLNDKQEKKQLCYCTSNITNRKDIFTNHYWLPQIMLQ